MAESSNTAAIVVEEEIAESRSIGGGGNARCSSAKETYANWNSDIIKFLGIRQCFTQG